MCLPWLRDSSCDEDASVPTAGFCFFPRGPAAESAELAERGEELGFDTCWLPDQTFYDDPIALLGALSVATSRIELGLGVTNAFSRHPVQVARSAHALASLSGGRFRLGLGAGNRKELLDRLGIEQHGVARRTCEAVWLIRQLLRGETVDAPEGLFPVHDVALQSADRVEVPIYVAARAPRMLAVAGEVGDGAIVECLLSPEAIAWARARLVVGAARAGRDPATMRYVAWGAGLLVDDPAEVPLALRSFAGHLIAAMPQEVVELLGLDPEKMARLRADYARGGPPAAGPYVGEAELAAMSFVGRPESVRRKVELLSAEGVDQVTFVLVGATAADNLALLERLAEQVLPALR